MLLISFFSIFLSFLICILITIYAIICPYQFHFIKYDEICCLYVKINIVQLHSICVTNLEVKGLNVSPHLLK